MRKSISSATGILIAIALMLSLQPGVKGEDRAADGAAIGKAAPGFALQDQNGKQVKLADYRGKIVVLEWLNPDCPFVQRHYHEQTFARLDEKYAGKGVVHLAINSGSGATPAVNREFAEANRVKYAVLDDSAGSVGKAYGAKTTPHVFVISREGLLVYKGAIDNDPDGAKSDRVNYVARALDELLAGKSVSEPETKSYGCGIHYR